jgi:flagellar basal-body rod protein FlgB
MMERLFNRGSLPALESMLSFAVARHRVIADNIANVDTGGYRARDLSVGDFRRAMARAYEAQRGPGAGAWTLERSRSVSPEGSGVRAEARPAADAGILKPGGNNVDLEVEMGRLVQNQSLHVFAAGLLSHQFLMLREAVAERVIA